MTKSAMQDSREPGAARSGWTRAIGPVGILALAIAAAWFFTRDGAPSSATAGHQHGTAATDGPQMFSLDTAAARRIGVTFAIVESGPLARTVRVPGRVTVDESRRSVIAAKVEGWVEDVFVLAAGEPVRAGDPLFSVYSPMFVAAQEELLLAARFAEDATTRGEAGETAAELLRAARRKLEFWDVPASEIDAVLASRQLRRALVMRAPRDGIVLAKQVVAGQPLMPGELAFELADLSQVWIEGALFESDVDAARLGAAVVVEVASSPPREITGRVTFVAPVVDEAARTVGIRVQAANRDGQLRPGALVTLRLETRSAGAVLSVPRRAVLVSGARALVFVQMEDGMLEPREVTLGVATDDRQAILSGLAAGEVVVASATFLVDAESNLRTALGGMAAMPGMPSAPTTTPKDDGLNHLDH